MFTPEQRRRPTGLMPFLHRLRPVLQAAQVALDGIVVTLLGGQILAFAKAFASASHIGFAKAGCRSAGGLFIAHGCLLPDRLPDGGLQLSFC